MPELTFKQQDWLDRLFLRYFPRVTNYPIEIFNKFLRFAGETPLVLPDHLQFKNEKNPNIPIMEFDIPEMLEDEPFISLIKGYLDELSKEARKKLLDELKTEVKKREFDIFEYLIRKEEKHFSIEFHNKFKSAGTYKEDVPQLFFDKLDENSILGEYNHEEECFTWDFSGLFRHSPHNIYYAYQLFAHKVYNLRGFGVSEKQTTTEYEALNKYFLNDYLKKEIPYYKNLHHKANSFSARSKQCNINRLGTYAELVNKELSVTVGDTDIHIPTDTAILINNIKRQSNDKWLDLQNSKIMNLVISESHQTTIRKKFNEIIEHLDSELISPDTKMRLKKADAPKAKLTRANAPKGEGGIFDKYKALRKLLNNPDNKDFLCLPEIKKIITSKFEEIMDENEKKLSTLSIDCPVNDEDGDKTTLRNILDQSHSINEKDTAKPLDEKIFDQIMDDKIMEAIRQNIRQQFPEELYKEFAENFAVFIKNRLYNDWNYFDSLREFDHKFNKLFDFYFNPEKFNNTALLTPMKGPFRKRMRNILHKDNMELLKKNIDNIINDKSGDRK